MRGAKRTGVLRRVSEGQVRRWIRPLLLSGVCPYVHERSSVFSCDVPIRDASPDSGVVMPRQSLTLLALGFAVAVSARPLASQGGNVAPPSAAELAQKLPFDPLVTVGTLDNGLRYYIMVNKLPAKRAELRLAVSSGAVFEANDQV